MMRQATFAPRRHTSLGEWCAPIGAEASVDNSKPGRWRG